MARESSDREDLLRDAVGIPHRVEFRISPEEPAIVIGFRTNGAVSIYWGQDEHFQFNTANQLRRAYWRDRLIKAESGKLISMRREQQSEHTVLLSQPMDQQTATDLIDRLRDVIQRLRQAMADHQIEVVGMVSSDHRNVLDEAAQWLKKMAGAITIANRPNVT